MTAIHDEKIKPETIAKEAKIESLLPKPTPPPEAQGSDPVSNIMSLAKNITGQLLSGVL